MFILDTDTFTHLLRGNAQIFARVTASEVEVVLTVVTRIEQLRGRFDSVFKSENGGLLLKAWNRLAETEEELNRFRILSIDESVSKHFDRLLTIKGLSRIGRGDLLIASIALANGAVIVTRNVKDFGKVPGLRIENWVD